MYQVLIKSKSKIHLKNQKKLNLQVKKRDINQC